MVRIPERLERPLARPVALVLVCAASVGGYLVLIRPLIAKLRARHPKLALEVVEGFSGHVNEWLTAGRLDVGSQSLERLEVCGPQTKELEELVQIVCVVAVLHGGQVLCASYRTTRPSAPHRNMAL